MKWTILAPQIGISPDGYLGGTVTDREILYRLADRGHCIHLLLPKGEKADPHPNIQMTFLPRNFLLRRSYTINFYFLPWMRKILKENPIPIVRIHSPYSIGITAPLVKAFCSRKVLLWYSFLHLEMRRDWALLDRFLPHFADGVTCISEDTRGELEMRFPGLSKKLVRVTPLGSDTSLFQRVKDSRLDDAFPLRGDQPLVLFVGRLIPRKGIRELLQTWEKLERQFPKAQLMIVGQGPLEGEITNFASHRSNVFHIPQIAHRRLPEVYSMADVFFLPTRKEGFGLVVAEAMSCELPVVTTEALGVRQLVVEGETGFKRPVGATDHFADSILYLLRHPEVARKMGACAREHVERYFTWDHGISATESFIEELATKSN